MNYSLRAPRADEIDWLYELKSEAYRDIVIRQFGVWDDEFQRKQFLDKRHSNRLAQIIVVGGVRVGVVAVEQREHYDWLREIQIKFEYREQGLGTSVMQQFIDQARSSGRRLRLQVLHENHRARQLYKRLGFVDIESIENHYLMEIE